MLPIPDYVMNDAVRSWEPKDDSALFFTFENGDYEPIILSGVPLRKRETRVKAEFAAWLSENGHEMPASFQEDNDELRFLFCHGLNFEESYTAMIAMEEYLDDYVVRLFSRRAEFDAYLEMGLLYGYHRDEQNRPVIVFNVRKLLDQNLDTSAILDLADYFFFYTIHHGMIPGKMETINLIVDVKDVPMREFPISDLVELGKRQKASQKLFIHNIVVVECHWLLKSAVQFIRNFVDPRAMGKVYIFTNNGSGHLQTIIPKDRLEKKYGGTQPNLEANFFPPRYNP